MLLVILLAIGIGKSTGDESWRLTAPERLATNMTSKQVGAGCEQ